MKLLRSSVTGLLLLQGASAFPGTSQSPPPGHGHPPPGHGLPGHGPPGHGPPPPPPPPGHGHLEPFSFFVNNTIYQPKGNESVTYPRFVETRDGTIYATTSFSGPNPPYFPVFRSKDGGASWKRVADIRDTVNGWGFAAQPALAELTEPLGGFKAGTLLASGNSWSDNGTRIDLYASTDKAKSWKFVSHVAEGTRPNTTNGATPIWEPYLLSVIFLLVKQIIHVTDLVRTESTTTPSSATTQTSATPTTAKS